MRILEEPSIYDITMEDKYGGGTVSLIKLNEFRQVVRWVQPLLPRIV